MELCFEALDTLWFSLMTPNDGVRNTYNNNLITFSFICPAIMSVVRAWGAGHTKTPGTSVAGWTNINFFLVHRVGFF